MARISRRHLCITCLTSASILAWLLAGESLVFSPRVDAQDPGVPPRGTPWPQLTFPGEPSLQATVGAAHRLALENLFRLNTIRDPKENHNRSGLFLDPPGTFIRAGGDYQTPWTRDSSINSWNAASLLSPEVALNTLWAVVERRSGKLIVQQDNQWWDQAIWVVAIWNHYLVTGDRSILAPAYETAVQTLTERRARNFNPRFGLFAGPSFFNDGISGYPPPLSAPGGGGPSFVLDHPATDKIMALSTNCVYVAAYRAAANLARELERPLPEAEILEARRTRSPRRSTGISGFPRNQFTVISCTEQARTRASSKSTRKAPAGIRHSVWVADAGKPAPWWPASTVNRKAFQASGRFPRLPPKTVPRTSQQRHLAARERSFGRTPPRQPARRK